MKKIDIKNKPTFLNNTQFLKLKNLEFEEKINPHAIWFQSMEPIYYAKNNENKLHKFKEVKINHKDTEVFRELLFNNLKKKLV